MKLTPMLTLLTAHLLAYTAALPTTHEYVALEIGRDYSIAELEELAKTQNGRRTDPAEQELGFSNQNNPEVSIATLNVSAIKKPIFLSQKGLVLFQGDCSLVPQEIYGVFFLKIMFDGHHVYWQPLKSSVGKFGEITIGGGYGHPITSSAAMSRTDCRYMNGYMCTYHFFVTATVKVTVLGKHPGITIDAVQPGHGDPRGGWMSENCVKLPAHAITGRCPPPGGRRCKLDEDPPIATDTWP